MPEFAHIRLRDLCDTVDYGLTASASPYPVGPRFLRITDIVGSVFSWDTVPFVAATPDQAERHRLHHGDIVIARTGATTGRSMWIADPPEAIFASYLVRLRVSSDFDSRFVGYLLKAPGFLQYVHGVTGGTSAQPNASASTLTDATLRLPVDIEAQRRIATVLGALDDKIAANDWAIQLIFELVQRMWEHASGHAEEAAAVASVAAIDKGISYKGTDLGSGTPLINLGNFSTGGRFKASGLKYYSGEVKDRHRIRGGELAVANTDLTQRREILGQPLLVPPNLEEALFTHHVFAVRPREGVSPGDMLWLYGAFRDREFRDRAITYATGTTVLALPKDAILEYELPWPSATVRRDWAQQARALLDLAGAYTSENATLAGLRDALLPGLMSGEIRVREAEAIPAEVDLTGRDEV